MDDADHGARGLRAQPGPALLHALREHWGLGRPAGAVDLGGSSSLNLLVDAAEGRYVARVHRPHLTPERLAAIHQARTALRAGGVPCTLPVPTTLDGAPWISLKGRLVEVEPYVDHDAKLDTWERLATAMPVLARAHNLLGPLEVGEAGRRPRFANHLEPAEVPSAVRRGTGRMRAWGPTPAERRLAAEAEELAELVTEAEAGLGSRLPRQLVHGDFWDNNVLFRHGRPVLVADFDFMGERARIDDLALTLHCARSDLSPAGGPPREPARLGRLVHGYDAALDLPLSAAERAVVPVAMARQALSSIGGWVARLDDEAAARRHAASAGPELVGARRMLAELDRWRDAFARWGAVVAVSCPSEPGAAGPGRPSAGGG